MTGDNSKAAAAQSPFQLVIAIVVAALAVFQAMKVEEIRRDPTLTVEEIKAQAQEDSQALSIQLSTAQLDLSERIETSKVAISQGQLQLAQSQFQADEKARRDGILQTYIPLLLSPATRDRQHAVAILLVAYPEDAKGIIETVASASSPEYQALLAPQIEAASEVQATQGPWIVVVANDLEYKDAQHNPQKLEGLGYSSSIYVIQDYYVTAAGPYPSEVDAETAQIAIRADVSGGAYVLNLSDACPYRELIGTTTGPGYFECSTTGPLGN
jgi:hypothetical protein